MAKLKDIALAEIIRKGGAVKVGNNRTITYLGDNVFGCSLHGNEIAQFQTQDDPRAMKVCLDHCGWEGTTTRQAMHDFMGYFGVQGSVSFAKGKFAVRFQDTDYQYQNIDNAPRVVTFHAGV